jgi:hypothetical protein
MLLLKHRLKGRCATALRDYIDIRLYVIITAKPESHVKSKCEKNFIVFLALSKTADLPLDSSKEVRRTL